MPSLRKLAAKPTDPVTNHPQPSEHNRGTTDMIIPRLRKAWDSEYMQPGVEGPPRDFQSLHHHRRPKALGVDDLLWLKLGRTIRRSAAVLAGALRLGEGRCHFWHVLARLQQDVGEYC